MLRITRYLALRQARNAVPTVREACRGFHIGIESLQSLLDEAVSTGEIVVNIPIDALTGNLFLTVASYSPEIISELFRESQSQNQTTAIGELPVTSADSLSPMLNQLRRASNGRLLPIPEIETIMAQHGINLGPNSRDLLFRLGHPSVSIGVDPGIVEGDQGVIRVVPRPQFQVFIDNEEVPVTSFTAQPATPPVTTTALQEEIDRLARRYGGSFDELIRNIRPTPEALQNIARSLRQQARADEVRTSGVSRGIVDRINQSDRAGRAGRANYELNSISNDMVTLASNRDFAALALHGYDVAVGYIHRLELALSNYLTTPEVVAILRRPDGSFPANSEYLWPEDLESPLQARITPDPTITITGTVTSTDWLPESVIPARTASPHRGRCRVCGKPLSHSRSVIRGMGPICAARIAHYVGLSVAAVADPVQVPENELRELIAQLPPDNRVTYTDEEKALTDFPFGIISVTAVVKMLKGLGIPAGRFIRAIGGDTGLLPPRSPLWTSIRIGNKRYVDKRVTENFADLTGESDASENIRTI